jgi:hypothetical protein
LSSSIFGGYLERLLIDRARLFLAIDFDASQNRNGFLFDVIQQRVEHKAFTFFTSLRFLLTSLPLRLPPNHLTNFAAMMTFT